MPDMIAVHAFSFFLDSGVELIKRNAERYASAAKDILPRLKSESPSFFFY